MHKNYDTIELTTQQKNIIEGLMLGDGCLYKQRSNGNPNLIIGRGITDEGYLKYHSRIFGNLLTEKYINNGGITYVERFDKRTNKIQSGCRLTTRALPCLLPIYDRWYPNGNKIVPKDVNLTSETIATWFCDDASICSWKLSYRFLIEISTCGFTKDEVLFLITLLKNRYDEDFSLKSLNRKRKTYYSIRAYDRAARPMIKDMDPYFPQGMARKRLWDNPITRFYINQPQKQNSRINDIANRKKNIITFLSENDNFLMSDLNKCLGFRAKGINYNGIYTYLNQYIENEYVLLSREPAEDNRWFVRITKEGRKYFEELKNEI